MHQLNDMDLELVTLRRHSLKLDGVRFVSMTSDLKLMGLLTVHHNLELRCLESEDDDALHLSEIHSYSWQEDAVINGCYRIICIDENCNLFNCDVTRHSEARISLGSPIKWCAKTIFKNFQSLFEDVKELKATSILRYEAKEAVICFNKKFVVTFSLLPSGNPQIISFIDVCENMFQACKISLVKETIFVLNQDGTVLSAYSISSNSKLLELDLMRNNMGSTSIGMVNNFAVSLEKDVVVLHTEHSYVYCMSLERSCDTFEFSSTETSGNVSVATVTAFKKQFPSVQRVHEGSRRTSITALSCFLQPTKLASDAENMELQYIAVYSEKLCFLLRGKECSFIGIRQLGIESTLSMTRLEGPVFVVQGNSETFPLVLLLEEKLSLILYDIERNTLINELMLYHCSKAAESLSHLNHWQNIRIDIEVLKQGIQNRQLDAVKFFFKTHEERFSQLLSKTNSENCAVEFSREHLLWTEFMDVLLSTIRSMCSDYHAHHFIKELLKIAISFVISMLDHVSQFEVKTSMNEGISSERESALLFFSRCLRQLREVLIDNLNNDIDDEASPSEQNISIYSSKILNQWTHWNKLSWKEVIEESLLRGSVALAQSYFLNHEDTSKAVYGSFQEFISVGLESVNGYLKQKSITEAVTILSNLGFPVNDKFVEIFQHTCERDIRETLVIELKSHNLLSDGDKKSFDFISILEKLYPCTSFLHAKQIQDEKDMILEECCRCAFQEVKMDGLAVGDFVEPSWNNCETGAYCRIILHWLSVWDNSIKERILLPQFLKGDYKLEISSSSAWNYLLEHGDMPLIFKWISCWVGRLSTSPSEFPYNWEITSTMINSICDMTSTHVADSALNELARYGVFCDQEQEDISMLLQRAGKSGCDLNNPVIFSSDRATISFNNFCHKLVHYCLDHDLISFLFRFCMKHYQRFISWPSCDTCDNSALKVVKSFCMWSENIEDSNAAVDAMLAATEYVCNIPKLSAKILLTKVPAPLNIAVLLFFPEPLYVIVKKALSSESDTLKLKNIASSYPLLVESLVEFKGDKHLPEVSIYQLLQGNSAFDPGRLFGWQSMNVLKSDDAFSELPHFLMPDLSNTYGLKEVLTHLYYLIEGRPNFAYLKFIAQELTSGKQISLPRVHQYCKQVFILALSNFNDEKLCAASVVFMELLGQDSLSLRTCLVNANMLYEEQCQKYESSDSRNKVFQEISFLFQNALDDKDTANKVVSILEAQIMQKMHSSGCRSLFEDIILWMPVVALAHFYDVNVGESYLCECAKLNDWLKLLMFSQVFQMRKEQVLKSVLKFSNPCIGNHIAKALEKEKCVPYHATKVQFQKKRDLRQSLYTRIGLKMEAPVSQESSATIVDDDDEENISTCSIDTSSSSDPNTGSIFIMKDLLLQLLQSHNSDIPWITLLRASLALLNPVLSVLAASYPDADILCCFTIWLTTSMPKKLPHKYRESDNTLDVLTSWSEDDLRNLMVEAVKDYRILLLWQGVSIFMPDSPLLPLIEYLVSFLVYKKFDLSREHLRKFQKSIADCKGNDPSSCNSLSWIENMSSVILKEAVISCRSRYERQLLLCHLSSDRILQKCSSAPDFSKLYNMIQCLNETEDIDNIEDFMLPSSSANYKSACWKSVRNLLQHNMYAKAENFAHIAGLPSEEVFLMQLRHEYEEIQNTAEWSCILNRITFWKRIFESIKQNKLKPQCIIEFLKDKCETADRYGERCYLMRLILQYCKQQNFEGINSCEMCMLRRNMWWCFIKEVETQELSCEEFDALLPSKESVIFEEAAHTSETLISSREIEALEKTVQSLLAKKELTQAFEVAKLFSHDSKDLKIIKLCLSLARGETDPKSVDIDDNMADNKHAHTFRKKSVVYRATSAEGTSPQAEVINIMQKLCEKTDVVAPICEQILVVFTVSTVLNHCFDDIYKETDPFVTLKNVLSSKQGQKFDLARSLIIAYDLKDENVASFLSAEIASSIQMVTESAVMLPENVLVTADDDEMIYNPSSVVESFQLTVKLCQDPSLLGKKLMDIFSAKFADFELNADASSLIMMVELCICAHNCFAAACTVDGISQVLHKSKKLVNLLAETKKFSLMVRLLTGIGRYSEMNYVFDKLHEHNQIESQLLKRKLCKIPHLRLALLDYLKRCPVSDNYYSVFVHFFNMEREIAEDREISARKNLALFCKSNSDPDLKKKLNDVMKDLVIASENYCQADCLLQAQMCAELVNLVALQLHLFDSGVWIIGLDDTIVARYITELNDFSEALIIADAYRHHQSWNHAVHHNVIVKGNRNYLREMQHYIGLPESLIEDVAKTFSLLQNKTEPQVKNMKWLLSFCENTELKHELALQLGFEDVIQELYMGDNAAFLQDVIATSSRRHL